MKQERLVILVVVILAIIAIAMWTSRRPKTVAYEGFRAKKGCNACTDAELAAKCKNLDEEEEEEPKKKKSDEESEDDD